MRREPVQQLTTRRSEEQTALNCSDSLVLRRERVRVAGIEGGPSSGIRWVQLQHLRDICRRCPREPCLCKIACELLVRPASRHCSSVLPEIEHIRRKGTYVMFNIPSVKMVPSSTTSPSADMSMHNLSLDRTSSIPMTTGTSAILPWIASC